MAADVILEPIQPGTSTGIPPVGAAGSNNKKAEPSCPPGRSRSAGRRSARKPRARLRAKTLDH